MRYFVALILPNHCNQNTSRGDAVSRSLVFVIYLAAIGSDRGHLLCVHYPTEAVDDRRSLAFVDRPPLANGTGHQASIYKGLFVV